MKEILGSPQEYKKRNGFLGRFLIFIGIFLIIIFAFFRIISVIIDSNSTGFLKSLYDISVSTAPESIAALGIIILFFGFLLLFLSRQFTKLAEIADEIEKNEEFNDEKE